MNRHLKIIISLIILVSTTSLIFAANKKLAQTGFQFLKITPDARGAGMGEAMTAINSNAASLFYNPAGMARQQKLLDVQLSQNQWIADISHNGLAVSIAPSHGRFGIIGLSLHSVDYGDIQGTVVSDNELGYIDTKIHTPQGMVIGLGYARALSDKFAVGGQTKLAYQNLGSSVVPDNDSMYTIINNVTHVIAYDFGTSFNTGWNDLTFGMSIRNFSPETKFETEGFELPLTFRLGISLELVNLIGMDSDNHGLRFGVDAIHPRDYSERINVGFEYSLRNFLMIRSGYMFNYDERGFTAGLGIQKNIGTTSLCINYAYTPFGIFDNVQRITLHMSI